MNNLKIVFLLLFLLIVSFFVFFGSKNRSKKEYSYTSIQVNNTIVNIGVKSKQDSSVAFFYIRNVGNDTLFVMDMVTDCHCTAISSSKTYAISGEELEIRAEYDKSSTGFFQQSIIVHTNSLESPTLFIMRGRITD